MKLIIAAAATVLVTGMAGAQAEDVLTKKGASFVNGLSHDIVGLAVARKDACDVLPCDVWLPLDQVSTDTPVAPGKGIARERFFLSTKADEQACLYSSKIDVAMTEGEAPVAVTLPALDLCVADGTSVITFKKHDDKVAAEQTYTDAEGNGQNITVVAE